LQSIPIGHRVPLTKSNKDFQTLIALTTPQTCIIILTIGATAHLILASVMGLYARYKVQYLALTWINAIFGFMMAFAAPFGKEIVEGKPGMFHPIMLLTLTVTSFLQSMYPLSIPMPAFLQWRRMVKYALPAMVLCGIYLILWALGAEIHLVHSLNDLLTPPYTGEILLRFVAIVLSVYYVVNVLLLPRRLAHSTNVPKYVDGYCTVLGFSVILYLACTIFYMPLLLIIYLVVFTMINAYLAYRTLETMAMHLPKPVIETVVEEPSEEVIEQAEREDFNEANRQHFLRVEFWMQNHKERWTQSTFNRDQLCAETGLNRHLLLQCVRSQGYNDTHEYLNTYRTEELKRLIKTGKVTAVVDSSDAGFGTSKTARSVFLKMEGVTLDDYLAQYQMSASTSLND